ncbi:glycosyltransferase family 4 protein, partial [Candidatus Kuenenbacteria bacterium]|nr:glycosyltransferase family 4 protein [Candidatus Kuenenbacteria bacterium]
MSSNQPTKILYLVTLSEWGGAQKYVFDLAVLAQAKGFDVSVAVGGKPDGQLLTLLSRFSVSSYYLRRLQRSLNLHDDLLAFIDIYKLVRRLKPDIIHLNSSKAGSLGALAAKLCGVKKIIYTVHGLVLNEPLSAPKRVFYWLSEWFS